MKQAIKVGAGIGAVVVVMELAYDGAMALLLHRVDGVVKTWRKK